MRHEYLGGHGASVVAHTSSPEVAAYPTRSQLSATAHRAAAGAGGLDSDTGAFGAAWPSGEGIADALSGYCLCW